jgi:galactoside O-acetyltransferase
MTKMSYYTQDELQGLGFQHIGSGVKLSRKASIYGAHFISIGDNSRVDDFCILSAGPGGIWIGHHVHIAAYSSLIGSCRMELHDYSGLSSRVSIYSSNDDYSGDSMTNPTIPRELTNISSSPVTIGRHVIVGAGSIVLPGVTMDEGSGIGSLSLVRHDCEAFGMYAGVPARKIGTRSKRLLELARSLDGLPEHASD